MDRIQCTHGVLRLRSGIRKIAAEIFQFQILSYSAASS